MDAQGVWSKTIRTARSRISGECLLGRPLNPVLSLNGPSDQPGTIHTLARLDQTQGKKARYKGTRKNTLDLRRCATVVNLQSLARLDRAA